MKKIKIFLTDCNGCMTDGGMYYTENGDEMKKFNTQDGMGFQILRENGIKIGIVTGEESNIVKRRAKKLQVNYLKENCIDKLTTVKKILDDCGCSWEELLFVGDDINDLPVMQHAGIACAVNNARPEIKKCAMYVTVKNGGDGAIREIIDWMMERDQ